MRKFMEVSDGYVGFGATKDEALNDLNINKCKFDINLDTTRRFQKRREELAPWFPRPNMLHISGIGCLVYENYKIMNTKTGYSMHISVKGQSTYHYLSRLVGSDLSYTDITVVLRPELDKFFRNISDEFTPINDMPLIRVSKRDVDFEPTTVYTTEHGIIISTSKTDIGLKFLGEEVYRVVELDTNDTPVIPLFAYLGYRLGVIFTDNNVVYTDAQEQEVFD